MARAEGLASPNAGEVANPASQAARWRLLQRAAEIDRKAAYESVSWGLGQVMGAHWAWLGFADVDALVAEAREGAAGQARLMARFIEKSGLTEAIRSQDWEAFAHAYNGPGFRRNAYHTKLAAAYRRHKGGEGVPGEVRGAVVGCVLGEGSMGEDVRDLQQNLSALGYPLAVDGIFGTAHGGSGARVPARPRARRRRRGGPEDARCNRQSVAIWCGWLVAVDVPLAIDTYILNHSRGSTPLTVSVLGPRHLPRRGQGNRIWQMARNPVASHPHPLPLPARGRGTLRRPCCAKPPTIGG